MLLVLTFLIVTRISAFFAKICEVTGSFSSIDIAARQLLTSYGPNRQAIFITIKSKKKHKVLPKPEAL